MFLSFLYHNNQQYISVSKESIHVTYIYMESCTHTYTVQTDAFKSLKQIKPSYRWWSALLIVNQTIYGYRFLLHDWHTSTVVRVRTTALFLYTLYTYICTLTHMHTHTPHTCTPTHAHAPTCAHTHTYTHPCTHAHTHHTPIHMYTPHTHVQTHTTHTHVHTYTHHTHRHTRIYLTVRIFK